MVRAHCSVMYETAADVQQSAKPVAFQSASIGLIATIELAEGHRINFGGTDAIEALINKLEALGDQVRAVKAQREAEAVTEGSQV